MASTTERRNHSRFCWCRWKRACVHSTSNYPRTTKSLVVSCAVCPAARAASAGIRGADEEVIKGRPREEGGARALCCGPQSAQLTPPRPRVTCSHTERGLSTTDELTPCEPRNTLQGVQRGEMDGGVNLPWRTSGSICWMMGTEQWEGATEIHMPECLSQEKTCRGNSVKRTHHDVQTRVASRTGRCPWSRRDGEASR